MEHLATSTAAFLAVGGLIGYKKSGSVASIAGSAAVAAVFLSSRYLILNTEGNTVFQGCCAGLTGGIATTLVGFMRISKTGYKPLPKVPAALVLIGLTNSIYYGMKAYQWKDSK